MTDTITPEERAELRELAQMVTPGPYSADGFDVQDADDTAVARCNGDINDLQEDTQESFAHFIADACNMAPRLLTALEAAEAERDKALQMNAERQAAITETALNALLAGITGENKSVGLNVAGYNCPYCGEISKTVEDATAHDATCPKHPAVVRATKAEAENERLRTELETARQLAASAHATAQAAWGGEIPSPLPGHKHMTEDDLAAMDAHLDCPLCGGSGHIGDCDATAAGEVARLTAERDWLAQVAAEDARDAAVDFDSYGEDVTAEYWIEAARRAVAGEGE